MAIRPTKVFFDLCRAFKAKKRFIGLQGSGRSGKTVGIWHFLRFFFETSTAYRRASLVSQSFPHLRDGAVHEFEKMCRRDKMVYPHNKGEKIIDINTSEVNYFSLDKDGAKVIGPDRNILWLNEPNKGIPFNAYNDMEIRTKDFIIADWNPSGEFWVHEENILERDDAIILHSTWLDNLRNLTKQQIKTFLDNKRKSKKFSYWDYWYKVYGEGVMAVLLDERVMPLLKWCKSVPADAIEIPAGLDFGFYPSPMVLVRMWVRKGELMDDLFIQEVVYQTRLSINSKSENVGNLTDLLSAKGFNKKHLVIADCEDPGAIQEMHGAKFNVAAVAKTSVETSVRLFHDYNIYVVEGSNNIYKEMDNYKFKRNKKGKLTESPEEGQADHAIDAIRYVLMNRNMRWSIRK